MGKDALFKYIPETRRKETKKHLHKVASQADRKSLIITLIARTIALSVEKQLTNQQCKQVSKDIIIPSFQHAGIYSRSDRSWEDYKWNNLEKFGSRHL
ncbi:hypothetical protein AVEN_242212-1 [Araneus ventricosus]|uniref:Uncharacterized protein n=1 Tax=Araneus ventricosus TaxID=182803 RepID=A0A4Y2FRJ2_ARAVE|nr:hypothetical protein AVEN_242212-1 [Araneus ventricosus]